MTSLEFTLVIPAYNEASRLADGLERLRPVFAHYGAEAFEIIIVNDGSGDSTSAVASDLFGRFPNFQLIELPNNEGKGAALRHGFFAARADKILFADADMSIDPRHFPALVDALDVADFAPGNRAVGNSIRYASPLRTAAGRMFNLVVRASTGTPLRDTQCGAKALRAPLARLLALLSFVDRFAFDAEYFYLAGQLGVTVTPQPVEWDEAQGSSVRVLRDSLSMLRDLWRIRRHDYRLTSLAFDNEHEARNLVDRLRELGVTDVIRARAETKNLLLFQSSSPLVAELAVSSVSLDELSEFQLAPN